MPFERPSLRDLISRVRADFRALLEGDPFLRRSFEQVASAVLAGLSHGLHGKMESLSRQVPPRDDSRPETILEWAALFLDPPRVLATKSAGTVVFEAGGSETVPEGREIQIADHEYVATADATADGGEVAVPIQAVAPGAASNVDAGAQAQLVTPVAGVSSEGEVAPDDDGEGLTGGTDDESIASVFARLILRLANPPRAGGTGDFEGWTFETPGVAVAKAWEFPRRNGAGTVGLAFTVQDEDPIPTSGQVDAVLQYIESKAPTWLRSIDVFAPSPVSPAWTVELEPNTDVVRDAVLAELSDVIDRFARPETDFLYSQIVGAVAAAEGVQDFAVSPAENPAVGAGELLVFDPNLVTFEDIE